VTAGVGTIGLGVGGTTAEVGVTAGVTEAGPVPTALRASIENVYVVPFVRPETEQLVVVDAQPADCGLDETAYEVIALPPLSAGADQDTVAAESEAVATGLSGADGISRGVTVSDAVDRALVPTALVAAT
jgi:hypothetical protein